MLQILEARLQPYGNQELSDVPAGLTKSRWTKDQIANICWLIAKAGEFQKKIYVCLIDHAKASDCMDHHNLWKILQGMGIPEHLPCLLRSLCAGQEAAAGAGREQAEQPDCRGEGGRPGRVSPVYSLLCSGSCECRAGWSTSWSPGCWGEIPATPDTQMIPFEWQKAKRN